MKETLTSKLLKYAVYSFIAVGILLVIVGLGFMTNFYSLFYNGTSEMYDFYKSVQALNKAIFNGALITVVMSVLLIGFDLNKSEHGPLATIYSCIVAGYTVMNGMVIQRAVPYFRGIYTAFDFSEVADYTPSTFAFTISQVLYGLAMALSVLIALLAIIRFVKTFKKREVATNG